MGNRQTGALLPLVFQVCVSRTPQPRLQPSGLVPSAHSHLQSLNSKISVQLNHSKMVSFFISALMAMRHAARIHADGGAPQDFASHVRSLTGTTQILHDRGVSAEALGDLSPTQEMDIAPKPQRLRHVMATLHYLLAFNPQAQDYHFVVDPIDHHHIVREGFPQLAHLKQLLPCGISVVSTPNLALALTAALQGSD